MDDFVKLIQGIGFPAAVAGYVLFRMERTMREVRDEIIKLRVMMEQK